MSDLLNKLKAFLKSYFNISNDLDDLDAARQSIVEGASFKGVNMIILIIAIVIASLGLNTNSAAVVIGAMLISPLMGPIIAIGLGIGTFDYDLTKKAARNLLMAVAVSVLASTIYFLISPVSESRSELLARTSPTIYDVFLGFFGGAAGIVAIACKQKGNVIPGVAIATALLPPLCTAGYGLATWHLQYFFGAFYLFIINSIFIAFATFIGVKILKFKTVTFVDPKRRQRIKRAITAIIICTLLPSIYLTINMLRDSYFTAAANNFIKEEFVFPNTQVFSKDVYVKDWKKEIHVTLIGQRLNTDSLQVAMLSRMQDNRLLRGSHLTITQGFSLEAPSGASGSDMATVIRTYMGQMDAQRATIDSLRSVLTSIEATDSLGYVIAPEIKVLYPNIKSIAIQRMMLTNVDSLTTDTINLALIRTAGPLRDEQKIREYLEVRTGLPDIRILRPGEALSR